MKMLKMCLNWKVLGSLAAVGVGGYLFAPGLLAEVDPILLLMMWAMQQSQEQGRQTTQETNTCLTREERTARLRVQQAALADRIEELEQEETRPAENARRW